MEPTDVSSLDARLRLLEQQGERLTHLTQRQARQLRTWRSIGLVACLGAIALMAGATRQVQVPELIAAQRFELRGQDGSVRAALQTLRNGGAALALLSREQKPMLHVGVGSDGSGEITITGQDLEPRCIMGVTPKGGTTLLLYGADRTKNKITLILEPDGTPKVTVVKDGVVTFQTPDKPVAD